VPAISLAAMLLIAPLLHLTNRPGVLGALATSCPLIPYVMLLTLVVRIFRPFS
jgi:hypothetical protein